MKDQLAELATIWAATNDRSVARLATRVANDGGFFNRLEQGGNLTTTMFERFLLFFRDGGNWKGGRIPDAAVALLDNFENIATEADASTGQIDKMSPATEPTPGARIGDSEIKPASEPAAQDEAA